MKFKVREGFVVHASKVVEIDMGNGDIKKEVQTNTYYQNQAVDFTPEEAEEHLHKLEGADAASKAYLETRTVAAPAASGPADGMNAELFAKAVAAAVAQALAAQAAANQANPSK